MGRALSHVGRVLAIALALTAQAAAGTLYVTPAGSDQPRDAGGAPRDTRQGPVAGGRWRQILLRSGTYTITTTLSITKTGVTLRSYPGERAKIVAGTGDLTNLTRIVVVYVSQVTIEDLELQGALYYGIKLDELHGPQSGTRSAACTSITPGATASRRKTPTAC